MMPAAASSAVLPTGFLRGVSTLRLSSGVGVEGPGPARSACCKDVMREVVAVGPRHGVDLDENYAKVRLKLADDVAYDVTSSMPGRCIRTPDERRSR